MSHKWDTSLAYNTQYVEATLENTKSSWDVTESTTKTNLQGWNNKQIRDFFRLKKIPDFTEFIHVTYVNEIKTETARKRERDWLIDCVY